MIDSNIAGEFPVAGALHAGEEASPEVELYKDVMGLIFKNLTSLKDVASCALVCRSWKVSADIAIERIVMAKVFGKEAWEKCFGKVGEVPPRPDFLFGILKSPCPIWPGKRVFETHTAFLKPATVNGKALSFNSLEELANSPKQGNETTYKHYDSDVQSEHGKTFVVEACWLLMTNDVLPDSKLKGFEKQQRMVKDLNQHANADYQVPEALEAAVLNIVTYVSTEKRLYSDNPWTWTRCQEIVQGRGRVFVGGFSPGGLGINCDVYDYDFGDNSNGMAARRKF